MKKTIVINGPGFAGKGTFIKMCRLFLHEKKIPTYSFTSIFPIKKYLLDSGKWDGKTKDESYRTLMAQTKQEMIEDGDIPLQYCLDKIKNVKEGLVFIHIREAEEITKFVEVHTEKFGEKAFTLHYKRVDPDLATFKSGVDLEKDTRRYKDYDFDIVNDVVGLEPMADLIQEFLEDFLDVEISYGIDVEDLEDESLHKDFNDEDLAGFV